MCTMLQNDRSLCVALKYIARNIRTFIARVGMGGDYCFLILNYKHQDMALHEFYKIWYLNKADTGLYSLENSISCRLGFAGIWNHWRENENIKKIMGYVLPVNHWKIHLEQYCYCFPFYSLLTFYLSNLQRAFSNVFCTAELRACLY